MVLLPPQGGLGVHGCLCVKQQIIRKLACLSNCCPVAKIKTLGCIWFLFHSIGRNWPEVSQRMMAVAMRMNIAFRQVTLLPHPSHIGPGLPWLKACMLNFQGPPWGHL